MSGLMWDLNVAAMILGYFALIIVVALVLFVIGKLTRELVHHHRRKTYEEAEMERARTQWFFEGLAQDRQDTDILDFPSTVDYEAVTYLKEQHSGHRKRSKPGFQARR